MKWKKLVSNKKLSYPIAIIISIIWIILAFFLISTKPVSYMPKSTYMNNISNVSKMKHSNQAWLVFKKNQGKFNSYNSNTIDEDVHILQVHKNHFGLTKVITPNTNATSQQNYESKNHKVELVHLYLKPSKNYAKHLQQIIKSTNVSSIAHRYLTGNSLATQSYLNHSVQKTLAIITLSLFILFAIMWYMSKSVLCAICSTLSSWISFMIIRHIFTFSTNQTTWQPLLLISAVAIYDLIFLLIYNYFKTQNQKLNSFKNAQHYILPITIIETLASLIWNWQLGITFVLAYLVLSTLMPSLQTILYKHSLTNQDNALNQSSQYRPSKFTVIILSLIFCIASGVSLVATPHFYQNYKGTPLLTSNMITKGQNVVNHNFGKGYLSPNTIEITSPKSLYNEQTMQKLDNITQRLKTERGVNSVKSITEPTGSTISQLYVKNQLTLITGKKKQTKNNSSLNSNADINNSNLAELKNIGNEADNINTALKNASTGIKVLGKKQSAIAKQTSKQLTTINTSVKHITSNSNQLGHQMGTLQRNLTNANDNIAKLNSSFKESHGYLNALQNSPVSNTFYVPNRILNSNAYSSARKAFMANNNHTTKLQVYVNGNPNSLTNMKRIYSLRNQVNNSLRGTGLHTHVNTHGYTSTMLKAQKSQHYVLIKALVSFLVLLILLGFYLKSWTVMYPLFVGFFSSLIGIAITHLYVPIFTTIPFIIISLTTLLSILITVLTTPKLPSIQDYLMMSKRQNRIERYSKIVHTAIIGTILLAVSISCLGGSIVSFELGISLLISSILVGVFAYHFNSFILMITKSLYR